MSDSRSPRQLRDTDCISSVTSGKDNDGKFKIVLHDGTELKIDALSPTYKQTWMSVFGKQVKEHSTKQKNELSRWGL